MAKLYVALSHFHPALLRTDPPGNETYEHDAGATYLVAQPFIVVTPGHRDHISVADYLRMWDAAAIETQGVAIIDPAINAEWQRDRIEVVPVPLPPDTCLRLHLRGATLAGVPVDWDDPRVLTGANSTGAGADEFLLDGSVGGWPGFAVLSSAQPQVGDYADLDGGAASGPQKTAVFRAMLGNFSALVQAYGAGAPVPDGARAVLWRELVEPHYAAHPLNGDEPVLAWWHAFLDQPHSTGASRIAWAYALLIKEEAALSASRGPTLGAPRFHWSDQALGSRGDLFLTSTGAPLAARSYVHALWHTLRDLATGEPGETRSMLERLFGFGERLAWPLARLQGALADTRRFMPLRTDLNHVTGLPGWLDPSKWFATNAPSLLGLVFRITPFNPADPPAALTSAGFSIGSAAIADPVALADSLNTYFSAIARDLASAPISVGATWGKEPGRQSTAATAADRFILFAPREAPLQALAASAVPPGRAFHAVPEALLDVVDDTPRTASGELGRLAAPNAARRGLFAGELLAYGALAGAGNRYAYRLAVALVQRNLAGLAGNAYALTMRNPVHPAESVVERWLADLPAGGAPPASLWIPQDGIGSPSTAEFVLTPDMLTRDIDGSLLIADPDPGKNGSLTSLLAANPLVVNPTGDKAKLPYLVFATTPASGQPFDLVEFAAAPASENIALALAPVTRLSISADRIAHSLALSWRPGFAPDGSRLDGNPTPKADHAADANKLRLRLAGPAGLARKLSDPDALLPLPPVPLKFDPRPWNRHGPVDPAGPQAWYWLAEHFDHDRYGDGGASENTRFSAWVRAGQPFALAGYVEHQLGHQVQLAQAQALELRRGIDIALPTDVQIGIRQDNVPDKPIGVRLPFVVVREEGADLRVTLDKRPAQFALSLLDGSTPAAAAQPNAAERDPVAALRALYRALAELRDSVNDGLAEVVIESWRFDNSALIGTAGVRGAGDGLTLAAGLVPDRNDPITLDLGGVGPQLLRLFDALDQDFGHFVRELSTAVAASSGDDLAVLASTPIAPYSVHGSYMRAGLRLTRPERVRAPASWADGAFIPVVDDDADPRAGAALADAARRELATHLSNPQSRAVGGLGWADPQPPVDQARAGPGSGHLLRPSGGTEIVERVLDLFYMPHAFALPRAHPAVGDRQATVDFASFLLTLLDDILAGRAVADRIGLTPPGDAAGAVALRVALRLLLARPGGIADALMALFVRVDVAATASSDARQALHCHAGRLLAALETLPNAAERPRNVVRGMLIAEPGLFRRARAIAIAPFNTHVPAASPDPTAAVNHSTFSKELYDFTIEKTILDDDGGSQHDTSRFSAADLRGDATYAYVLDVLAEQRYDDTVTIASAVYRGVDPHDDSKFGLPRRFSDVEQAPAATVRRGETVAEPEAGNGIAINVVHVFPQWRRRQATELISQYVLPERRMPPRPRPVDVCLAGRPGVRAAHSVVSPSITGTLPTINLMAQWTGSTGAPGAYDRAIAELGKVDIATAEQDTPRKAYVRIAPASTGADPARTSLPQMHSKEHAQIDGWHTLTAELSHFWFEMALDKKDGSLVANLDDNAYEIEVEMWSGVPSAPAAPAEQDVAAVGQDRLLAAFRRWRAGQSGTQAGDAPTMTLAELPGLVEKWLVSPPAATPWRSQSLLEKASARDFHTSTDHPAWTRSFRIIRLEAGGWHIGETGARPAHGGLGAVAGFEILARPLKDGSAPRYDDMVPLERLSALIRISVLDHPFHVSRIRLRSLRNWRSVDGDEIPDIHADLILAERYTDWVSELRQPVVLGPATANWAALPGASRQLRVVKPGSTPPLRIKEWLDKSRVAGSTIDFGFALSDCLNAPAFIDSSVPGNKVQALWPTEWMSNDGFALQAVIRRTLPDISFRYGDGAAVTVIAERHIDAPRQILAPRPATTLPTLLDQVSPAEVVSLEHVAELIWRDKEGAEVLRAQLPIVFTV